MHPKKEKSYLHTKYEDNIRPEFIKKGDYSNVHQVPFLKKIVLNMGLGKKMQDKSARESARSALASISGQQPCVTYAKQSISTFKIREGMELGFKVTLRGELMYEFLHRWINGAMPRIRDFRGVSSKSFDGNGNFAMGIKECHIFYEIKYDDIKDIHGLDIVIVTSAKTDKEAKSLLKAFNMPFRQSDKEDKSLFKASNIPFRQ